jgi:maltose phosphorylase
MLGVTGPNEYENNVNNNWYTNYIARWCIEYALKVNADLSESIGNALTEKEITDWKKIVSNVYFPKIENSRVFLQQDGFLDKELLNAQDIPESERPINQNWSWDRILRSVFIKQADVLQGLYLFEDHFDQQTIQDNFNFYEPKTVHESSLSPCVHVIIAAKIGMMKKAYELYLRTSRLDLDDYNHEADEGLHITSMAGTWMSIVEGMAGVRITEKGLSVQPHIPKVWKKYAFQILFKQSPIFIEVNQESCNITNNGINNVDFTINNILCSLNAGETSSFKLN